MAILVPANDVVALAERIHQLRHHFKQIPDQPVIRHLEDRRIRILVDGDDDLGVLHPGQMLDGTGDADREVELWRDDLAGLADLVVIRARNRRRPQHGWRRARHRACRRAVRAAW
jgi:hypothetical protein